MISTAWHRFSRFVIASLLIWAFTSIQVSAQTSSDFCERALVKLQLFQLDQAIVDFDSAIRIDPLNVKAYYNRGNAWGQKGAYEKAIADFTEAIRIDPKDARYYHNRVLFDW